MRACILILAAALSAAAAGCGESECASVGKKMCSKACDCPSSDGKCHMGVGFTITFDDEADCKSFFSFGCSGNESNVDFGACSEALDDAQCVAQGEDSALDIPEECNEQADAGP